MIPYSSKKIRIKNKKIGHHDSFCTLPSISNTGLIMFSKTLASTPVTLYPWVCMLKQGVADVGGGTKADDHSVALKHYHPPSAQQSVGFLVPIPVHVCTVDGAVPRPCVHVTTAAKCSVEHWQHATQETLYAIAGGTTCSIHYADT